MNAAKTNGVPKRDDIKIRVAIVDDHPVVRFGLIQLIADEPDLAVCGQAANAQEAIELAQAVKPNVMVIDISLRDGNGIELIKQIRALDGSIRLVVHSMYDESLFAERAILAGAMGYVNMQETTDNLITAIRRVLKGEVYLSPNMTNKMLQGISRGGGKPVAPVLSTLSDRELEIFGMIGDGLTIRQIAAKLHLSPKTIETHRARMRKKLDIHSNPELIRRASQWKLEQG